MMAAQGVVKRNAVALWQEYRQTRDVGIRNSLVLQNLGLVYRLASQHAALAGDCLDDLVQEGCLGLIRAVERFRPEHGVRFSTYAYPVISGTIKNYLRARRRLLGRREGPGEQAGEARGGNRVASAIGEELIAPEDLDLLAEATEEDIADRVVERVLTGDLLARLPSAERQVVTHFFYEDLTQREIGRLVARSSSRVCRLLRSGLERLRATMLEVQQEDSRLYEAAEPDGLRVASLVDAETGLFGPVQLQRCLTREVKRAEALGAPLSLALLRPRGESGWVTPGELRRAARYVYRNVRVLDQVFRAGPGELALVLSLPGAEVARICARLEMEGAPVPLDCSIRSCPADAASARGLLAGAYSELDQR